MITPISLHDAICDFLQTEVGKKIKLKGVKREEFQMMECLKHPQIVRSGWILPKSIDESETQIEEAFPYIAPRIMRVENKTPGETLVILLISLGVYDPGQYDDHGIRIHDGSGYRDLWNLIEMIRQAFFISGIIDRKYRLVNDFFEAEMLNEQVYPYWEGYCKTKWHVFCPFPTERSL